MKLHTSQAFPAKKLLQITTFSCYRLHAWKPQRKLAPTTALIRQIRKPEPHTPDPKPGGNLPFRRLCVNLGCGLAAVGAFRGWKGLAWDSSALEDYL